MYLMHTLNILSLNVTGLNSAVKRTCVLEHLHRKSISGALICNTASSGTFLHVFWECPVVIDLWTRVNLVLSSSLQTDCFADTGLCLLDDDSGLFISLIQKRRLFAGFAAARRTMMQNWCAPHVCGEAYWIHGLLRVVTCGCATARVDGARPFTVDAWQCFFFCFFSNIRDYIKEVRVLLLLFPSLSLSLLIGPLKYGVCICCFVLFVLSECYVVMLCVKRNKKNVDKKKKKE